LQKEHNNNHTQAQAINTNYHENVVIVVNNRL